MADAPSPRVLISYSHDSLEHGYRVLELADRLRADGVDAIIDQYIQSPPDHVATRTPLTRIASKVG